MLDTDGSNMTIPGHNLLILGEKSTQKVHFRMQKLQTTIFRQSASDMVVLNTYILLPTRYPLTALIERSLDPLQVIAAY